MALIGQGFTHVVVTPLRIVERDQPDWIDTQLKVRDDQNTLFSTTISLTEHDIKQLTEGLHSVASGYRSRFEMESDDRDLVVSVGRRSTFPDLFFSIWIGEPYQLMRGFQFPVGADTLRNFANELERESSAIVSGGAQQT